MGGGGGRGHSWSLFYVTYLRQWINKRVPNILSTRSHEKTQAETNSWELDSVRSYHSFKADWAIGKHNTIIRGSRIIIPKSLQKRAVDIAQESH